MAEMTSYVGIEPRTIIPTAVALARGVRVTRAANGLVSVADASIRGEYVTLHDIALSVPGAAASLSGGGKVPALAFEAAAVGDAAYSAVLGRFSKTATGNVVLGRWTMAASGNGVLGEVELSSVL